MYSSCKLGIRSIKSFWDILNLTTSLVLKLASLAVNEIIVSIISNFKLCRAIKLWNVTKNNREKVISRFNYIEKVNPLFQIVHNKSMLKNECLKCLNVENL